MDVEENNILWLDMEMSGLNPDVDHILEIACMITDKNLKIIGDTFHEVIATEDSILDNMGTWCREQHKKSGLTEKCRTSGCTLSDAEDKLLAFVKRYLSQGAQIAGNSVYVDRLFLRKYMPRANEYFHYRIIDVSSVRELVRRWYPDVFKKLPKKVLNHRALDDIRETIQELSFLKQNAFIPTALE